MKAALVLVAIYIGMFLVAIQGSSPDSVQAAAQSANTQNSGNIASVDPVKDSDIRALLELVGARDQVQDSVKQIAEQYREKLLATVPDNEKGQAFVNTAVNEYEKRYDVDKVHEQLVVLYDKHYSDAEIKGLLQFYGSPLGQKWRQRVPKSSGRFKKPLAPKPPGPYEMLFSKPSRKIPVSAKTPASLVSVAL